MVLLLAVTRRYSQLMRPPGDGLSIFPSSLPINHPSRAALLPLQLQLHSRSHAYRRSPTAASATQPDPSPTQAQPPPESRPARSDAKRAPVPLRSARCARDLLDSDGPVCRISFAGTRSFNLNSYLNLRGCQFLGTAHRSASHRRASHPIACAAQAPSPKAPPSPQTPRARAWRASKKATRAPAARTRFAAG